MHVLVVSRPQLPIQATPGWLFNSLDLSYLSGGAGGAWALLGTLHLLYALLLAAGFYLRRESPIRRDARYYAYWRERRRRRVAVCPEAAEVRERASCAEQLGATWAHMQAQHYALRLFSTRYDATLADPSAALTAVQKVRASTATTSARLGSA